MTELLGIFYDSHIVCIYRQEENSQENRQAMSGPGMLVGGTGVRRNPAFQGSNPQYYEAINDIDNESIEIHFVSYYHHLIRNLLT